MNGLIIQLLLSPVFWTSPSAVSYQVLYTPEMGEVTVFKNDQISEESVQFVVLGPLSSPESEQKFTSALLANSRLVVEVRLDQFAHMRGDDHLSHQIFRMARALEKREDFRSFSEPRIHNFTPNFLAQESRRPAAIPETSITSQVPTQILTPETIKTTWFVVLYSGDGGWSEFTSKLADEYKRRGVPVVGINSLNYFWQRKEPARVGQDLGMLLEYYGKLWGLSEAHVVGYSFGADVLPFALEYLKQNQRNLVREVALLNPSVNADFELHVWDWITDADVGTPVIDAFDNPNLRFTNYKWKCVYGERDRLGACQRALATNNFPGVIFRLRGDHHFNHDFLQFDGILW